MSDTNKAIVHRFIEAFNSGDVNQLDEICQPEYEYHGPGKELRGLEATKELMQSYRDGFPDVEMTVQDAIAEGDRVVVRWSAHGANTGELHGMPPTGEEVTVSGTAVFRVESGKLAEEWETFEELQMLQQMGIVPIGLDEVVAVEI